jgi:hypothetical protein
MEYRRCQECRRPIRPRDTTKAQHPGTVANGGRGLCSGCHWRDRNNSRTREEANAARRVFHPGDHCKDCDRPLRHHLTRAADAPGTVAHRTAGRCAPCHRKWKEAQAQPTPVDPEQNPALRAWLNARRRRIAQHQNQPQRNAA